MHYTKPVFRPAFEGDVPLLQVTDGCSYNKCSFCSMYRTVPFRVSPDEEIEQDLYELRNMYRHMPRLFLVNGDPFCLSTKRLAAIGERIRYYFPECETICSPILATSSPAEPAMCGVRKTLGSAYSSLPATGGSG